MGLGQFLSVDWFTACSDSEKTSPASTSTSPSSCKLTTSSVCVCHQSIYRLREWCVIISLPVPWVCLLCQCASMPEVCQHARGSFQKCLYFPGHFLEVPAVLDVLKVKTLCHCARWLKTHKTVLMVIAFTCNDDICVLSLSCDSLLAVFVTINCFIV